MGRKRHLSSESSNGHPNPVVCPTLYSLLGVEPNASQKDICRAFRLRAMKLHPDKRLNDDYEKSKSDFQELQRAYAILSDPEKRRQFDEYGDEEGSLDADTASRIYSVFRKVTAEDIELFESSYKGSAEERQDVLDFYDRTHGNFHELFEYIPLSRPEEVDRFICILREIWQERRDVTKKQFSATCDALKKRATKFAVKESRERSQASAEEKKACFDALAVAIQKKAKDRRKDLDSFLENLESKYHRPPRTKAAPQKSSAKLQEVLNPDLSPRDSVTLKRSRREETPPAQPSTRLRHKLP